jgi:hypothetical protein
MVAGLANHFWSLLDWLILPAVHPKEATREQVAWMHAHARSIMDGNLMPPLPLVSILVS